MSQGVPYADLLILALVAGFILLRLRSVLGNKPDEDSHFLKKDVRPPLVNPADTIIQLDTKSLKPKPYEEADPMALAIENNDQKKAIGDIKALDPQFSVTAFMDGAKRAFEMVFDAFAKGDKPTLKMLLSDALYDTFSREIDNRQGLDIKTETTLVSVKANDISDVSLNKSTARIGVHFVSEQVTVMRDLNGEIIGGDASTISHVDDQWVFERDASSKNPNWKIIET